MIVVRRLEMIALCNKLYVAGIGRVDRTAFRAIFLVGFFGLLRPGELVKGGTSQHTIRSSDITLSGQQLRIRIPSSKTSAGPHTVTLDARQGSCFCPVQAIRDFLEVRPHGESQLFVDASGSAISKARLSAMLKRTAVLAGLSSIGISGHCLRISLSWPLMAPHKVRPSCSWQRPAGGGPEPCAVTFGVPCLLDVS